MRTVPKPAKGAMYVATQFDKDWLRSEQRKLYARSGTNPTTCSRKLWGLSRTAEPAARVRARRLQQGARTPGVEGHR